MIKSAGSVVERIEDIPYYEGLDLVLRDEIGTLYQVEDVTEQPDLTVIVQIKRLDHD